MTETAQLIRHLAVQSVGDTRSFVLGKVQSYDSSTHSVRVELPIYANEDGQPAITPLIPLASQWIGSGYGFQAAPKGGELCLVALVEQETGLMFVANLLYTGVVAPPGALAPGEAVLQHETGSQIKFHENGDMTLIAAKDLIASVAGDALIEVGQNVLVSAGESVLVESAQEVLVSSEQSITLSAGDECNIVSTNSVSVTGLNVVLQSVDEVAIDSAKEVNITAADNINLTAQEDITISALQSGRTVNLIGDKIAIQAIDLLTVTAKDMTVSTTASLTTDSPTTEMKGDHMKFGDDNTVDCTIWGNTTKVRGDSILKLLGPEIHLGGHDAADQKADYIRITAKGGGGGNNIDILAGGTGTNATINILTEGNATRVTNIGTSVCGTSFESAASGRVTTTSEHVKFEVNDDFVVEADVAEIGTSSTASVSLAGQSISVTAVHNLTLSGDNTGLLGLTTCTVTSPGTLNIEATGATSMNITGDTIGIEAINSVLLRAPSITSGSTGASMKKLLTEDFLAVYNGHVHPNPEGGFVGGVTIAGNSSHCTTDTKAA